jgi:hypothetical protein
MNKLYPLILAILAFASSPAHSQNFYALDTIQQIEISFSQSNWDYILDTAKQGSDSYTLAQWVRINGIQFDSVGVKYKGNSSYNPAFPKCPLHIELDHFKNHNYLGFKDIKLSNGFHEPSCIREVMLYDMAQHYMKASRANFAQVYINGQLWGLYTNAEAVTGTFLDDRFYSSNNTFVFADNGGCDLRYKGPDTLLYQTPYTLKSDFGLTDLRDLCDSLKNNINAIENILDVDRTLWMLAFTNALVILDSYLGNSKHNYYLYEDHIKRFNPIIWDLNGGLGIFNKLNPGGTGLTTLQMQQLSPMAHSVDSAWPLIRNILAVPMFKRMYIAHMKTIMQEQIDNGNYLTTAQYLQGIADTAVQSDPNAFYTYAQFLSNLNNTVIDGPKVIPGITELMSARSTYLNATAEFMQTSPTIGIVASSNTFPLINTPVYITAQVSNANAVYIGSRNSMMDRFLRQPMFDDGLHGDGMAGDGVYGVQITVTQPQLQYYIYAENANAGMFSPQRAEHEFHILNSNYTTLNPGDVVINEFMALNTQTVTNASGQYEDWIELYNTTNHAVSLDFLNLSDKFSNTVKWTFPQGIVIPANSYQIVWADDEPFSGELHCNFKLSGDGEQVIISYPNGVIIDSVSFPAQSSNVTWGRYPNGTGPFNFLTPTFNASNSPLGLISNDNNIMVSVYPNPSTGQIIVSINRGNLLRFTLKDVLGHIVIEQPIEASKMGINLQVPAGLYFYDLLDQDSHRYTGKLIVR